jgi:hypothetical protein
MASPASALVSPIWSATDPMMGGPNRNPAYPTVNTADSEGPDGGILPAALNSTGSALAMPTPAIANPTSDTGIWPTAIAMPMLIATIANPPMTSRTGPVRWLTPSPVRRPNVIPNENTANPAAARPGSAWRSPRR